MTNKFEETQMKVQELNRWACTNGIALVVVTVTDQRIVSLDHLDCQGISDEDNFIGKRISTAMKAEASKVAEELGGFKTIAMSLSPKTKFQD